MKVKSSKTRVEVIAASIQLVSVSMRETPGNSMSSFRGERVKISNNTQRSVYGLQETLVKSNH